MSIGNYLTALDEQRDALARNLVTMGVQASETEKLNTLVPKVLQIPQTKPDVTLFRASIDALHDYGEKVYTFYNDGYRSLSGFTESYQHFCCEENGYAIYYNQPDFNWGQTIYTMCVEPVHISTSNKIMLSYKSATVIGVVSATASTAAFFLCVVFFAVSVFGFAGFLGIVHAPPRFFSL